MLRNVHAHSARLVEICTWVVILLMMNYGQNRIIQDGCYNSKHLEINAIGLVKKCINFQITAALFIQL